jgi:hypothetical protein
MNIGRAVRALAILAGAAAACWLVAAPPPGQGQPLVPFSCVYNSSLPTVTSGSFVALQCDANGKLILSTPGVTSVTAGDAEMTISPTTGAVVVTPALISLAHGGTNAALTADNGAIPYSSASALALLAHGTSGQVLSSGGAGAPTWLTLSAGTGLAYSAGAFSLSTPVSLALGGTAANLTASAGGVLYSSGSALAILPGGAGNAGKFLMSGGTGPPAWSAPVNTPNRASVFAGSPGSTSSITTYASTGVGVTVTPTASGDVMVWVSGLFQNPQAAGDFAIYRNTTGVPGQSSGVGSDTKIAEKVSVAITVSNYSDVAFFGRSTGLTLGTSYSFYLAFRATGGVGGTVTGANSGTDMMAVEQ